MRGFEIGVAAVLLAWVQLIGPAQASQAPALSAIYRFPAPPPGFDPASATPAALAAYGFPPRPVDRHARDGAAWVQAMHAARFYVAPQVRAIARHGMPAIDFASAALGSVISNNWAGQAIQNGTGGYGPAAYTEVMGQWVISGVQQAVGMCSGTDVSSTWVGIDGLSGSTDVVQAGTEADAVCSGGVTAQNTYAWFEWYPANQFEITNFPMTRGGSVFVVVQATNATNAIATLVNLQTGQYTIVGFAAPAGTALRGNCVEWIVERPSTGNSNTPGTLADFGEIPMESEISYLVSELNTPNFNVPGLPGIGQTGEDVTMLNTSNVTLATTVPQGTSAQLVQVAGPTE